MIVQKIRHLIFLRDVAWLSITAFGGPQVHIAMFLDLFVKKRAYLSEQEFLELNALCQVLPGPSSTQTIVALGFKIGGARLAYLTLLVWSLPGVLIMTIFGMAFSYMHEQKISLAFMRFVQPIAVGFVCYAAVKLTRLVIDSRTGIILMVLSTLAAYFFRSPWVFPLVVVLGGLITSLNYHEHPEVRNKKLHIKWDNFILFWGVLIFAALLGNLTGWKWVLLFENFYRNGSFIFGGGQVLIPVLLTEFVKFKGYLSEDEFLSGYALSPFVPGPVFSFVAFIGVLSMRDCGTEWELLGALMASTGVFLPGAFIIFFVIRFWDELKKYRGIKASLEGIHAASSGLVIGGALILIVPLSADWLNLLIVLASFLTLQFTKFPQPLLIVVGILGGVLYQYFL
jgi:chromate transporter